MQQTPLEYISEKGFEYRQQSGQIVLKTCPVCGDDKWHCYVDPGEGGPWFCHKCQEKGNLWTLKKIMGDIDQEWKPAGRQQKQREVIRPAFGNKGHKKPDPGKADRYHQALLKDAEAMAYLHGRGILDESIERFRIGLYSNKGTRWITIPHYQGGELVNIKFRSLPPAEKTFRRIPDCKSVLFNVDALKGRQEIILTEGELDAISLIQAGADNVIGATNGAGAFDPEWIDQLKTLKKIFIAYDSDEAGQKGARALAKRLGYNRCYNMELPDGQDINDYFQAGNDVFDFQKLKANARKYDLPGVVGMETALDLLERERASGDNAGGLKTPWPNVNRFIKGFRPGDLIILTAPPKTGKTSWALDISRTLSLDGQPTLFYCLEMRAERLCRKLIEAHYRVEEPTADHIRQARNDLAGLPLYFAYSFKKQSLDDVLSLIREAIQRYDLRFIVFDNLHFLIRSVSNVNEELGQAVQGFKLLAEEMEIPIMAIAQPRKRDTTGRDEIMRADDIKYSNSVHADCDLMIILHRKRNASTAKEFNKATFTAKTEALEPVTLVRVEAHRYGSGGETALFFHGEYSRFDEIENPEPQPHWTDNY